MIYIQSIKNTEKVEVLKQYINNQKEKAYWIQNELGQWQEVVFSLNKPSEKHFGRIWIEASPEDGLKQLEELNLEYEEIK